MSIDPVGIACVESVSVRCRNKERGTRVKDCAKDGASKRAGRGVGKKGRRPRPTEGDSGHAPLTPAPSPR